MARSCAVPTNPRVVLMYSRTGLTGPRACSGAHMPTCSGDRASANNGMVFATTDVCASSVQQRILVLTSADEEIVWQEETRAVTLNALSATPATKRKFKLLKGGESDNDVIPEASFFVVNKVMMNKLLSEFSCR